MPLRRFDTTKMLRREESLFRTLLFMLFIFIYYFLENLLISGFPRDNSDKLAKETLRFIAARESEGHAPQVKESGKYFRAEF